MNNQEILWLEAYNLVPRVLGLIDRDPISYTYGCVDRHYWHYKTSDMANARLQDAGWLLALIYQVQVKGNRYYKKRKVAEWALACIQWWMKIQHRNGSFDEVYPYEYSFCATAFSTWWVAETLLELKKIDLGFLEAERIVSVQEEATIAERLERAGKWLMRNNNFEVGNQQAASIAALGAIYVITGKEEYLANAQKKLSRLISVQDSSGYYPEYAGSDIGYHSLTLTCLYSYKIHVQADSVLEQSLSRALDFLDARIHEDGRYEWTQTSRRTQYLYPYSLPASNTLSGKIILERFLKGLNNDLTLRPSWIDDRFCTFFAIDFLRTYRLGSDTAC